MAGGDHGRIGIATNRMFLAADANSRAIAFFGFTLVRALFDDRAVINTVAQCRVNRAQGLPSRLRAAFQAESADEAPPRPTSRLSFFFSGQVVMNRGGDNQRQHHRGQQSADDRDRQRALQFGAGAQADRQRR